MSGRRFLLVANAQAGTASEQSLAAAVAVLGAAAPVEVARTRSADDLARVLGRVDEATVLVSVGGDGSLHAVANALEAEGLLASVPVGIVPLGTGNDLARCLGIPLDPSAAAEVVLRGAPRRLDVLVDDTGDVVVNAVHAGVGAEAARAAEGWKQRLGRAGYVVGSAVAGIRVAGWRLRVRVDDRLLRDGADPLLMVGLGNGTSIGGGTPLTPDADPADGKVDVMVSASTGVVARLGFASALGSGEHVERDDVVTDRGGTVRVEAVSEDDRFSVNADGEVEGPLESRSWRVRPAAWRVIVRTGLPDAAPDAAPDTRAGHARRTRAPDTGGAGMSTP